MHAATDSLPTISLLRSLRSVVRVRAVRSLLTASICLMQIAGAIRAQDCVPGPQGCFGPSYDWTCQILGPGVEPPEPHACPFLEISHAALIPHGNQSGKVLFWNHDCSGATAVTWVFDPSNPTILGRVVADLETSIFCAGMSWNASGQLVVAGGINPAGIAAYRFRPGLMGASGTPGSCTPAPITGRPWTNSGQVPNLSWQRFYPTLITLAKELIPSFAVPPNPDIAGASTFVIGGTDFGSCPGINGPCGNEFFQCYQSTTNSWTRTFVPNSGGLHAPPAGAIEAYVRLPVGNPPDPHFDSYPRMFQLTDILNGAVIEENNIFVANDINTQYPDENATNTEGSSWVIKPTYDGSFSEWQLHRGLPADTDSTDPNIHFDRHYGTAVLLHTLQSNLPQSNGKNRVLVFGGAEDISAPDGNPSTYAWQLTSSVQEFRPNTNPVAGDWVEKTVTLQKPRLFGNSVVLPTGEVLIVGGSSSIDLGLGPIGVQETRPELYYPGESGVSSGATSAMMATPQTVPGFAHPYVRLYHNLALLLPDGRVFTLGGDRFPDVNFPDGRWSGEMFSPPYLAYSFRPGIISAPMQIAFDDVPFDVTLEYAVHNINHEIDRIVLLRPAAVTHSFDSDQRYIELAFEPGTFPPLGTDERVFHVTPPASDLGPPGYYMLFAIERKTTLQQVVQRSPSVARFIQIL